MNKKELVKTLMKRMEDFGYFPTFTNVKTFIKEYEKLAKPEPQKPVVPQFVADWYEENKDDFEGNLFRCAHNIPSIFDGAKLNEFERWFINASTKPFQILVNMHQFGYEVEREKRYLVKIKSTGQCLGKYYINNETLSPRFIYTGRNADGFTRKELEVAGFEWVFDCEGIEIEEVEK
jgi:gp178